MSKDIQLFETGSGGDFSIVGADLLLSETLFQNIYISLFGGNIETSTKGNEIEGELRSDYWGNSLFENNNPSKQFNSETERIVCNIVLNASGRIEVEKAVAQDLAHLSEIVNLEIQVAITGLSSLSITIGITEAPNQQEKRLQFIVDQAKTEVIINQFI